MATEEDSVEQVAAARKERLRALRAAQELLNTPDEKTSGGEDKDNGVIEDTEETNLSMKFRNYVPHDKELQEGKLAPPVLPKFEDPVANEPPQLKERNRKSKRSQLKEMMSKMVQRDSTLLEVICLGG
ncbi:uncharacterized protein LOC111022269 isoform X2 [Momordica charantia]|uniref:Uncharacterized protein LOC111022269 isoform X2 n=1 Tax=Momordica charantia TaxID=3673 RepID=A0A6J1DQS7_MOMCH|nr:uncharacterized protein LOC111022269 isoform X2 [Momordica charantia]